MKLVGGSGALGNGRPMLRVEATTRVGALELDLSLSVEPGRCLALAGPSGSGKTSTLRVAAGLRHPARGRVECGGEVWLDTEAGVDYRPSGGAAATCSRSTRSFRT